MSNRKRYLALDLVLILAVLGLVFQFFYAVGHAAEQSEYVVSDWCRAHPDKCGLPTPNRSTKE